MFEDERKVRHDSDRMVFLSNVQVVLDQLKCEPLAAKSDSAIVALKNLVEEDIKTWSIGHNSLTKKDYLVLEKEIQKAEDTLALILGRLVEGPPR